MTIQYLITAYISKKKTQQMKSFKLTTIPNDSERVRTIEKERLKKKPLEMKLMSEI